MNFKHYSNKALIERINKRFAQDLNDDDECYELSERRKANKIKFKVVGDTYEIINEGLKNEL